MLYFSQLKKEELTKYAVLTRKELSSEEYYSPEYLIEEWDNVESYVLKNSKEEWVGWCAISSKCDICNPEGKRLLSSVIFPQFRRQGYCKYIYKICFEKTLGKNKLTCINPYNDVFIKVAKKYGFIPHNTNKIWNTYICDKNLYPTELKKLPLTELM